MNFTAMDYEGCNLDEFLGELDDLQQDQKSDVIDFDSFPAILEVPDDPLDDIEWLLGSFKAPPKWETPQMTSSEGDEDGRDDFPRTPERGETSNNRKKQRSKRTSGRVWSQLAPVGIGIGFGGGRVRMGRKCKHCGTEKTPQWRMGPMGPKTLCNACGVRYRSGRLVPEYRPAASPSYDSRIHSNSHRRIVKMTRREKFEYKNSLPSY